MSFQIGDKIRAIATERESGYSITNVDNNWIGEVEMIDIYSILVFWHNEYGDKISDWVNPQYFEKIDSGGRHTKSKKKKLQYQF